MPNRSHSIEFKLEVIQAYHQETYSVRELCSKYQIHNTSLYEWVEKFEKAGKKGLEKSRTSKNYPAILKEAAVRDYLSGQHSLHEVARNYNISNKSVLRVWIKKYNSHRKLEDTGIRRSNSMTKGRTITWEEKKEIAVYCMENGKDYQGTADKYKVSYQQVYKWVKKYETMGAEALKDNRGRTKSESELSPDEKIKLQMKRLKWENERLRAENEFLKKLEEIERRSK
jgi:transposase